MQPPGAADELAGRAPSPRHEIVAARADRARAPGHLVTERIETLAGLQGAPRAHGRRALVL